jgi:1,2-diacylglycerol 3-alpha-glucosyltransferase
MRVGICAFWFNRGQGVVARQLRSGLDRLGHQTFVLGRPTKESFPMPQEAREDDVWAQQGVTPASDFFIPAEELVGWASEHDLDACFFDQNYEFDAIGALRASGVRTIGRFVWERFSDEHVEPARRAYETIYAMTAAERERYRRMGIEAPFLQWGIHPDYEAVEPRRSSPPVSFHYHAGLLGKRKPFKEIVQAFSATDNPDLRLIVKAQIERRMKFLQKAARRDSRIELVLEDLPTDEHLQMCADADVCMAPARWEGLGLHLYEAIAFGQPILCNDDPPMNELVTDGVNGLLVPSHADGEANSGIPAKTVAVPALTAAIERLADPELRAALEHGARRRRDELSWERAVESIAELVG